MHVNPVDWFEIYVEDMDRARRFYEQVLGVTLNALPVDIPMYAFPGSPDGRGAAGALVQVPGVESGRNSTVVYFSCEDCAVESDRAAEAGGTVARLKMSIGAFGFVALVRDTEGNLVGLRSMR